MDLALVTGFGPSLLTDLEDLRPIVRPEDAVAFGFRDHEDQREYGSRPLPDELPTFDIHRIRQLGAEQAARDAVDYLTRQDVEGFFIHLDADVLDDAVMPAVDFRVPGGLSPRELATVLEVAIASDKAVGLEVTIYNPRLDRDGRAGHVLVDVLCKRCRPKDRRRHELRGNSAMRQVLSVFVDPSATLAREFESHAQRNVNRLASHSRWPPGCALQYCGRRRRECGIVS
jgi:hypothetical protein